MRLVEQLRGGERVALGAWLSLASVGVAEIFGSAGFDWVLADQQHSHLGPSEMLDLVRAIETTPASPVVRIPANSPEYFAYALDAGAHAVMVPMIEDRASAERAVRSFRYPPGGTRSIGGYRAHLAHHMTRPGYLAAPPALLVLQLEHRRAIENVDDIASVPGVDVLFVGPQDLSASYGLAPVLRPEDPKVSAALDLVNAAARRHGLATGILSADVADARDARTRGFGMIAVGTDASLLTAAARSVIDGFSAREITK